MTSSACPRLFSCWESVPRAIAEYLAGYNLGIDQSLALDQASQTTLHPGRMSLATAFNFFILGIALLLLDVELGSGRYPSQWLVLLAGFISLIALLGYAYDVEALDRSGLKSLCARAAKGRTVFASRSKIMENASMPLTSASYFPSFSRSSRMRQQIARHRLWLGVDKENRRSAERRSWSDKRPGSGQHILCDPAAYGKVQN